MLYKYNIINYITSEKSSHAVKIETTSTTVGKMYLLLFTSLLY